MPKGSQSCSSLMELFTLYFLIKYQPMLLKEYRLHYIFHPGSSRQTYLLMYLLWKAALGTDAFACYMCSCLCYWNRKWKSTFPACHKGEQYCWTIWGELLAVEFCNPFFFICSHEVSRCIVNFWSEASNGSFFLLNVWWWLWWDPLWYLINSWGEKGFCCLGTLPGSLLLNRQE